MSLQLSMHNISHSLTNLPTITSFNPSSREWLSESQGDSSSVQVPHIEGTLYLASLHDLDQELAPSKTLAVLQPKSPNDIADILRFARQYNLTVSSRGNIQCIPEHLYQSCNILIQMSSFNTIHAIQPDYIDVDAGVYWYDLLLESLKINRVPPVLTNHTKLTVGGTLSIGGIGGTSYRYGVQIDNVLELQVVTGESKIVTCSPRHKPDLFFAMLAGQGQCGIITRARIRLIEAPQCVRMFFLHYNDIDDFNSDQIKLIHNEQFQFVEGHVTVDARHQALYEIIVANFSNEPQLAPSEHDLAELNYNPSRMHFKDCSYSDFLNELEERLGPTKETPRKDAQLRWYEVFIPASQIHTYIDTYLNSLHVNELDNTHMLIHPIKTSRFRMPFFRVPNESIVFACHILSISPLFHNNNSFFTHKQQLFEQVRRLGGTHYSSNTMPLSPEEWREHFGPVWPLLSAAKQRYDPHFLLSPEQNIFR